MTKKNLTVINVKHNTNLIDKINSFRLIFNKLFWEEIFIIIKDLKTPIFIGFLKIIFVSLGNANRLENIYLKLINKFNSKIPIF